MSTPSLLQRFKAFRARRRARAKAAALSKSKAPPSRRKVILLWSGGVVAAAAFFFWYTSARILGEPVEISQGVKDPVFGYSLGSLLGAEFTRGNRVTPLVNGDEFFPEMLKAIREAKHTITLETYIWTSGQISDQFIAALTERSRAGVKVHVLADGMGTLKLKDEDQHLMLDAGVEFRLYGREHWYEIKPDINHRTHRKIMVVDGRIGFTGGMCIDDRWLGHAQSPEVWRETQVRVEGPVIRQMQAVFATNWLQTTAKLLFGEDYFPVVPPDGSSYVQCYKSGPDEDAENARVSYLVAIAAARHRIQIGHAYFVPDDLAIDMLLKARQRGVEIDVVIPAINDSRFGRAASRSRWGKLLAAGVKFYQYEPAMYHAKTMIVDDDFFTVGSVNFDNRSFGINDEMNINVLDDQVVRRAREIFEDDKKHSKPLTLEEFRGRPWWQKGLDHFCGLFRSQL